MGTGQQSEGPWLTMYEIDSRHYQPKIVDEWSCVEGMRRECEDDADLSGATLVVIPLAEVLAAPKALDILASLAGLTHEPDPVTIGCHCTLTDAGDGNGAGDVLRCVWCKIDELIGAVRPGAKGHMPKTADPVNRLLED